MENIIMLILGVLISVVGIVNIKGNISTIHSYNRRRVKERRYTKVWKNCWNRNTDYRNISCVRFYCFVLERRNYGLYHSDSDYYRIRFDSLWSIQI